jgi:HEAT repeat protein
LVRCSPCGSVGVGQTRRPPSRAPAQRVGARGKDAARDALQTLGHPMLDLPQAVAQVAAQGAWGVLIRALTCTQVREVVVGLGAPAVPPLIQALGDSDRDVRRAAAEALGKLGDPQAVPPLIKALGDSDWDVRRAAAEALGKLGDPQAVPPLSVWAHAGKDAARDALQTLGHPMLDLPQAVAQVAAQGAWGVLIRALTCTQVREVVVGLGAPAVPPLIQALGDSDRDVRCAAAEALVKIGTPAVPPLIQALGDRSENVRAAAAEALGAIGDPQAVPPLIQALGDSDWDVRCAAAWALGKLGDPQAVPALIQALGDYDGRFTAAEALVRIGAPAVPALIQALGDSNWAVRHAAAWALGKLGDPQAVPPLIQALGDRSENVRAAAAEALGAIGDPQAVPALIKALGDSDWDVRCAAAEALGKLGDPQAMPRAHPSVGRTQACSPHGTRCSVGQTRRPPSRAPAHRKHVGVLIRALTCAQVRRSWCWAQLGAPAVPPLIQALGDSDWDVRVRQRKRWAQSATPKPSPRS